MRLAAAGPGQAGRVAAGMTAGPRVRGQAEQLASWAAWEGKWGGVISRPFEKLPHDTQCTTI